jgi:orotidine-5'-phosphate decarboxylase
MVKLVVALDFSNVDSALKLVDKLGSAVDFYKIGLELMMTKNYFSLLSALEKRQKKIFADLKLYDISQTVAKAIANLTQYNIELLTIHTASTEIMLTANENKKHIKIIGVTVLTSLDKHNLLEMGFDPNLTVENLVYKKTKLALECGLDGVVASALEALVLRKNFGNNFAIVTPGIRFANNENEDQKRVATVEFAIQNGSSHLVVGRPITASSNPIAVVENINKIIYATHTNIIQN